MAKKRKVKMSLSSEAGRKPEKDEQVA